MEATKPLLVIHELLQYRKELLASFIPPIKVVIYREFRKRSVTGDDT
jgi:hypothetical protein